MTKARCGLCDVEVEDFGEHRKSEQHQSNLPEHKEVKKPKIPVKKISATEKKKNKKLSLIAKVTNLGYFSQANGRSGYFLRCECGEDSFVFSWRGCKRCPNCWKILHLSLSI